MIQIKFSTWLIIASVVIIIIGIITLSAAKSATPGALLTTLGFLLGVGGAFLTYKQN
jgi:uncharacterized membrane protein YgaE (UPF0421/DUF939 family)